MAIISIVWGVVIFFLENKKSQYSSVAAFIGMLTSYTIGGVMIIHLWRTTLSITNCIIAGWIPSNVPLDSSVFGDHTAICGSKALVVTQFVYSSIVCICMGYRVCVLVTQIEGYLNQSTTNDMGERKNQ
jgi:hypothetical protein